jgi:hypothetical protein
VIAAVAAAAVLCALAPALAAATPSVRDVCAPPPNPHTYRCLSLLRTDRTPRTEEQVRAVGNVFPGSFGYSPAQLQSAYGLTSAAATRGSGATVAIIDAYNDPNAASDLATYRTAAGLPACTTANGCFKQLDQNGQAGSGSLPPDAGDTGWDVEESLDIDMVSAICPKCKIDLIEADSASDSDLDTAANTGASLANFESNSYGVSEYLGEQSEDTYFDHPGKVITAAAGDSGYGVDYPAASPDVTAVGGTSLQPAKNARRWTETVWGPDGGKGSTGSGCSQYEPKPSWQTDSGCANRTVADVSMDADPDHGVAVYDTFSQGGWLEVGGTSASSPMIAAVYALAGAPKAGTNPASYPYKENFELYDVTSGTNSDLPCNPAYWCTGEVGYDGPTGLGTPDGIDAFMASPPPNTPPTATISSPATGQTFRVGQAVPTAFSCAEGTGGPGLASCSDSNGVLTTSGGTGTLNTSAAGSFTYGVNAKSIDGTTGTASISYTVVDPTADLTVRIRGPHRAKAGTSFVETLKVTNAGPAAATNVRSAVRIPRGVTIRRTGGGRRHDGAVHWFARSLGPGRTATYRVRFKVRKHANRRVTIRATARSGRVTDPNPSDDVARSAIKLHAAPKRHHVHKHPRHPGSKAGSRLISDR